MKEFDSSQIPGSISPRADQFVYTEKTSGTLYLPTNTDGLWDGDRFSRLLQATTEKRLGVRIGILKWRHIAKAIMRRYASDQEGLSEVLSITNSEDSVKSHTADDIRDLQAAHSSHYAGMHYARDAADIFSDVTWNMRQKFQAVSTEWHTIMGFTAFSDVGHVTGRFTSMEQDADAIHRRRSAELHALDPLRALRTVLGDLTARFRGSQEAVIRAVVQGKTPILAIMATGAGKSMAFLLPAVAVADGVTVVIVPLIALREDIRRRCETLGIPYATWDSSRPSESARIVLVTPEAAEGKAFRTFLGRQRALGQLDRIVVDECHNILDATDEFRPCFFALKDLVQMRTQLVYLTATLPPDEVHAFCSRTGLHMDDLHVIRDSTSRPNLQYSVVSRRSTEVDGYLRELVEQRLMEYPTKKVVVYCRSRQRAEAVGALLGCPHYHAKSGDEAEKRSLVDAFINGSVMKIASTSALGEGIDAPKIGATIHDEAPRKLRHYSQESGRAGRNGHPAMALIIQRSDNTAQNTPGQYDAAMQDYLRGASCRRVVFARALDGFEDRTPCRNEEYCDFCLRQTQCKRPASSAMVPETPQKDSKAPRIDSSPGWTASSLPWPTPPVTFPPRPRHPANSFDGLSSPSQPAPASLVTQVELNMREGMANRPNERRMALADMETVTPERLGELCELWQGNCMICLVHDRAAAGHRWEDCTSDGSGDDARRLREFYSTHLWKRHFDLQKYCGCYSCQLPQATCASWEAVSPGLRPRFRRKPHSVGWACQHPEILRIFIALIFSVDSPVTMRSRASIVAKATSSGATAKPSTTPSALLEWPVVLPWLGQRWAPATMESCNMCREFVSVAIETWPTVEARP